MKTFIIAEAGVNHNGDINIAKRMIDEAVTAGVDAVKFQTWKTELLSTRDSKIAEYQGKNANSPKTQFELLKQLELPYESFVELKNYCDKKNITFISTADEIESADFLRSLQDIFKIGSGELTNVPYLRHLGAFGKKIILSTGMANLKEIGTALNILINAGTKKDDITVLHCTTEYPAPMNEVNLNAIKTIADTFDIKVGYSDHTQGIEAAIAAVAIGAVVIEKHFTLDKDMKGPDHTASIDTKELRQMVKAIRNIEQALGDGVKQPSPAELRNREIVRKKIVTATYIAKGTLLTEKNLTTKRASYGISAALWDAVIGKYADRDYRADQPIIQNFLQPHP